MAPLRKVAGALYGAQPSLLLDLPRRTFPEIEAAIRRYCGTKSDWVDPNVCIAKLLFDFNESRKIKTVEWEFPTLPVGFGAKIKFWHDFYFVQDGRPVLSFLDPRLNDGLGIFGRTFVFSAMYHNIAVGDFDGARLEIVRCPRNKETGEREVEIFSFDERDLVDEAILNEAINGTFKIWNEVVAKRVEEIRRTPLTGSDDDFGF